MQSPEPCDVANPRTDLSVSHDGPSIRPGPGEAVETLSLILPIADGTTPDPSAIEHYRRLIEESGAYRSVEVVVVGPEADLAAASGDDLSGDALTLIPIGWGDWSDRARAGLSAATGDHLMVLDLARPYAVATMLDLVEPIAAGDSELVVAVPARGALGRLGLAPLQFGLGLAGRLVLGSSDVFSGLFVLRRSLWERGGRRLIASSPSLVMELLLRKPYRSVDVDVPVGPRFRRHRFQLRDLRPLKHVLDGRYGSLSRLLQFCCVGASGMVVDLTFYALFQWVLSFTAMAGARSERFGFSWSLAIAAAMSIGLALVWNFTLNRRLTFNDARGGSWIRQFLTYALSNALAIALSFTVRLYLPARVAFFARHRLAAAVVGIVAATGVSFSMSRWIVFARQPDRSRPPHVHNPNQLSDQPSPHATAEPIGSQAKVGA